MVKQEFVEKETSHKNNVQIFIKRSSSFYEYLKLCAALTMIFSCSSLVSAEKYDKAKQIEENTRRTCEVLF